MDLNDLRAAVTLIGLLVFLGIVRWAWQRSRSAAFDEAAGLPLTDDRQPGANR